MKKKLFTLLLCAAMLISLFPASAFAVVTVPLTVTGPAPALGKDASWNKADYTIAQEGISIDQIEWLYDPPTSETAEDPGSAYFVVPTTKPAFMPGRYYKLWLYVSPTEGKFPGTLAATYNGESVTAVVLNGGASAVLELVFDPLIQTVEKPVYKGDIPADGTPHKLCEFYNFDILPDGTYASFVQDTTQRILPLTQILDLEGTDPMEDQITVLLPFGYVFPDKTNMMDCPFRIVDLLEGGEYCVEFDPWDGQAGVKVNGVSVENGEQKEFSAHEELLLTLLPPAERAGELILAEVWFGEDMIPLDVNPDNTIRFVPETDDPFTIHITWSFFDAFWYGDGQFLVQTNCGDGGEIALSPEPEHSEELKNEAKSVYELDTDVTAVISPEDGYAVQLLALGSAVYAEEPQEGEMSFSDLPEFVSFDEAAGTFTVTISGMKEWNCFYLEAQFVGTREYEMLEGMDSVWNTASSDGLRFRSSAPFEKFDHVEVDGVLLDESDYGVSEGSTVVILRRAFLKTLSLGKHVIVVFAKDGRADAEFTVVRNPKTGDSFGTFGYGLALCGISVIGLAAVRDRKRRVEH